jgi:multidrug efflux pump subunit AcrA (membrane-fusion protein)
MSRRFQLLCLIPLLLLSTSCGDKIEPGTVKVSRPVVTGLQLETARIVSQPLIYDAVGTVQAGITSNLAAKLMGSLERIAVREGDEVKKGDILVTLDQRQARAGLRQAQASFAEAEQELSAAISARDAARANAELAAVTYERYLALKGEDSVSAQEFDEVEARYRQARAAGTQAEAMVAAATARSRQAKAGLTAAKVTLRDTLIEAPHNGIITAIPVDEGDLATPGQTLLVLETVKGYRIDLVLPETYIDYVRPGQVVSATVPALNLKIADGIITTVVPAADPGSRSFLIKVALPTNVPVKSGMFARTQIPIGEHNLILVPRSAVVSHGQLNGIYLVDGEGVARFRLVRLGRDIANEVEVLSGMAEGDRYVLQPPPDLVDGTRVEKTS